MKRPGTQRSGRRLLLSATLLAAASPLLGSSLADRLQEPYLSAMRRNAQELRQTAQPLPRNGALQDFRCILHAHSRLSHDSLGTEQQILAAAKSAGVRAVFMTEHPTPDHKWRTEGLSGEKDGVLFVPGAEHSDGLLVWRGGTADWTPGMKAREVLESLKGTDGVAFVAHPEQRKTDAEWDLPPYAGMEIYNSHADAADSGFEKVLETLKGGNVLRILTTFGLLKKYQPEAYAAIFDEQTEVLKRWDTLNERALRGGPRVAGIAANDAHQNVGVSFQSAEEGLVIKDALGKKLGEVRKDKLPLVLPSSAKPGTPILEHTFDPYAIAFGYVSTHVLAGAPTETELLEAVRKGRAYVAFDWIADPTGFRFQAQDGARVIEMGGDVAAATRPVLQVAAGMPCQLRLIRGGQEVRRVEGTELTHEVREPGVYRVEAWVRLGDELRPWVYTNPIYALAAP